MIGITNPTSYIGEKFALPFVESLAAEAWDKIDGPPLEAIPFEGGELMAIREEAAMARLQIESFATTAPKLAPKVIELEFEVLPKLANQAQSLLKIPKTIDVVSEVTRVENGAPIEPPIPVPPQLLVLPNRGSQLALPAPVVQLALPSTPNILALPQGAPPVAYGTPFAQLSRPALKRLEAKVAARTITREEWARLSWFKRLTDRRQAGIDGFWEDERELLASGFPGSRNWNSSALTQILGGGQPSGIFTHHRYSVSLYPQLANDPNFLWPTTFYEHFYKWHNGSWRNPTHGVPLNPDSPDSF